MYRFTNPIKNVYSIFSNESYIGQVLMKDGYIKDIELYDCSHTDFMKSFMFEVGVDEIYANVKKCYRDYYQELGFKIVPGTLNNKMIYSIYAK